MARTKLTARLPSKVKRTFKEDKTSKKEKIIEIQKEVTIEDMNLSDTDREDYHNNVDILFVMDTTSSMEPYIEKSIEAIKKIIEKFNKMQFNIKLALCTYRDHPPQEFSYITKFTDLTSARNIIKILSETTAQGGGDIPEAVMDGLRDGLTNTSWRLGEDKETKSKRFLFHVCDAPPHGLEYSNDLTQWSKTGCPCGTKKENIASLLADKNVDYHLVKATHNLDLMEIRFKAVFGKHFCDTITIDIEEDEPKEEPKKKAAKKITKKSPISKPPKTASKKKKTISPKTSQKKTVPKKKKLWKGIVNVLEKKLS